MNTIVIKSNVYEKTNQFFWINEHEYLEDLSEKTSSFFSKTKAHYKEIREAKITDIADEIIQEIKNQYEVSDGMCIVVNGTEEDFIYMKEKVEEKYPQGEVMCIFGNDCLRSAEEVIPEIIETYKKLGKILLPYSNEEQEKFFWNLIDGKGDLTLIQKCKRADDNVGEILEAVENILQAKKQAIEYEMEDKQKAIKMFPSEEKKKLEEKYRNFDNFIKKKFLDQAKIGHTYTGASDYNGKRLGEYINIRSEELKERIEEFVICCIELLKRDTCELVRENYYCRR